MHRSLYLRLIVAALVVMVPAMCGNIIMRVAKVGPPGVQTEWLGAVNSPLVGGDVNLTGNNAYIFNTNQATFDGFVTKCEVYSTGASFNAEIAVSTGGPGGGSYTDTASQNVTIPTCAAGNCLNEFNLSPALSISTGQRLGFWFAAGAGSVRRTTSGGDGYNFIGDAGNTAHTNRAADTFTASGNTAADMQVRCENSDTAPSVCTEGDGCAPEFLRADAAGKGVTNVARAGFVMQRGNTHVMYFRHNDVTTVQNRIFYHQCHLDQSIVTDVVHGFGADTPHPDNWKYRYRNQQSTGPIYEDMMPGYGVGATTGQTWAHVLIQRDGVGGDASGVDVLLYKETAPGAWEFVSSATQNATLFDPLLNNQTITLGSYAACGSGPSGAGSRIDVGYSYFIQTDFNSATFATRQQGVEDLLGCTIENDQLMQGWAMQCDGCDGASEPDIPSLATGGTPRVLVARGNMVPPPGDPTLWTNGGLNSGNTGTVTGGAGGTPGSSSYCWQ